MFCELLTEQIYSVC